jgi:hypothetical protein
MLARAVPAAGRSATEPSLVSRGFYDARANGRSFARAFNEGRTALKLKGFDDS